VRTEEELVEVVRVVEVVLVVLLTSAGFFWLRAGVPGLLPYLLVEQKDVEGPERGSRRRRRGQTWENIGDLHRLETYTTWRSTPSGDLQHLHPGLQSKFQNLYPPYFTFARPSF